ncbi:WD40-repeat-containing domain [Pseudocohnilembus persalinus]|uniref:WD40-repeat-containing domain n=1 Tax=Pseudocohnilembus persalinus TaxID=266149 RepID=A0A0V0R1B3_PSEPJ|nr:WD40-repeat-containing domain [Pseudocohnilembus persalinus]|eukprot:KRX08074.1 WD40-repeat-containing domain [Pseudocohnilembus persalinus]
MKSKFEPKPIKIQDEDQIIQVQVTQNITTVATDNLFKYAFIGGNQCLKLMEINSGNKLFVERKNLKSKIPQPTYISWNPINNDKVGVVSQLQGTVTIFTIEASPNFVSNTSIQIDEPRILKFNWHPTNENLMITCRQDVNEDQIKLWDLTNISEGKLRDPIMCFTASETVLDLKFNPHDPNYFVVGLSNGTIQYFNMNEQYPIISKMVHTGEIYTLDWNTSYPGILAIGSFDREMKILLLHGNQEFEEKSKMKYITKIRHIQWSQKNPLQIYVVAFQVDCTMIVYDVSNMYKPKQIYRGHLNNIITINFSQNEEYLLTSSKEGYIQLRKSDINYKLYDFVTRNPVVFDINNNLAFKSEQPSFTPLEKNNEDDMQINENEISQQYAQFEQQGEKAISRNRRRNTSRDFIQNQNYFKGIGKSSSGVELNQMLGINGANANKSYFLQNYEQMTQNYNKSIQIGNQTPQQSSYIANSINNSNALKVQNQDINEIIDNSKLILNRDVAIINNINKLWDNDYSMSIKEELEYLQSNYLMEGSLDKIVQHNVYVAQKLKKQNVVKTWKQFHKFFQSIEVKENQNQSNVSKQNNQEQGQEDQQQSSVNGKTDKVIIDSCMSLLQQLINEGELQSAIFIFNTFFEYLYVGKEQEAQISKWYVSYIELLKRFEMYKFVNILVQKFKLQLLKMQNGLFISKCTKCGTIMENKDKKSQCKKCRNTLLCSICNLPIKGLLIWCQVCGHAGHFKEMGDWFKKKKNQFCPAGCGHQCFSSKSLFI